MDANGVIEIQCDAFFHWIYDLRRSSNGKLTVLVAP